MQAGTTALCDFYSQAFSRVFRSVRKQTLELSNSVVRYVNHHAKKYRCQLSKSKDRQALRPLGIMVRVAALIFFAIANLESTIEDTRWAGSDCFPRPWPARWRPAKWSNARHQS